MFFSEIIRFTLPSITSAAFQDLRRRVASQGVENQYFGYVLANEGFPLPQKKNQLCWVIQWPENVDMRTSPAFRSQLNEIAEGGDVSSLLFEFNDSCLDELARGLEAPVCEFAVIRLAPNTPRSDPGFQHSMNKTFTDCYKMVPGFTGGGWAYALNSNDPAGVKADAPEVGQQVVKKGDEMLAYYYLGWPSVKVHDAWAATPIFDEEIDKLKPWFGEGTGAYYVTFTKHV